MSAPLKNVLVSAVVLVVALGLAGNEWTGDELRVSDGVSIVDNQLEALERVAWSTEEEEVVMEFRTDDAGSYWWVEHTTYEWIEEEVEEAPIPTEPEPELEAEEVAVDAEAEGLESDEEEEFELELEDDLLRFLSFFDFFFFLSHLSPVGGIWAWAAA